ncbi:MAG: hypothetical protein AAFY45_01565 [Bacteroidota bacterium]
MPKKAIIFLAFANDRVEDALYLRNLPKELDGVRKALYLAEKMGLCEVVERANVTIDHIVSVFQDERYRDRIAVFHYGGHADGYELLLESLDGSPVASQAGGLVPFFARQKGLKLVFLNGCANRPQALEMKAAGIPFVIGTNQVINDAIATQLAIRFYKGLAEGLTLARAWAQAEDEINMSHRTGTLFRAMKFKSKTGEPINDHPWEIHIAEGAEAVKDWSLPKASGNLLFGLPDLPKDIVPPQQPFLFFKRYERKDAYVFFGRSFYIREIYNRVTNLEGPPLILLYGQSGVGKSSLLEAGVFPYLEHDYAIEIVRRKPEWGLSGSLQKALDGVEKKHDVQGIVGAGVKTGEGANTELASPIQQLMVQMEESLKALEEKEAPESRILREKLQAMKTHSEEMLAGIQQKEEEKKTSQQIRQQKLEKVKDKSGFLYQWLLLEARLDSPVILILDQVEEVFTRPGEDSKELTDFFQEVRAIFEQPDLRPEGKLLLSYRKEYHAEIEESCKALSISRSYVFVERLKKADIIEVITGLKAARFRDHYSFEIEEEAEGELANKIADELLSDSNSSVAPILQILVTKMWDQSEDANNHHCFSDDLYEELKDKGILLDKFFEQQVDEVRKELGPIVESGLLLDLLHRHTTRLGTADSQSLDTLREFYNHRSDDLAKLIAACKDRYLLSEGVSQLYLVHDTLAPLVQKAFRESDLPGQRAYRILDNKIADFEQDKSITLDQLDLSLVEKGEAGMRIWEPAERELVHLSRLRRENEKKAQKRRWMAFGLLMASIAILGIVSWFQKENIKQQSKTIVKQNDSINDQNELISGQIESIRKQNETITDQKDSIKSKEDEAIAQRNEAYRQTRIARTENFVNQSNSLIKEENPQALEKAIAAWKERPGNSSYRALLQAYHFSPVPQTVGTFKDRGLDVATSPNGKYFAAGSEDGSILLYGEKMQSPRLFDEHSAAINDILLLDSYLISVAKDGAMEIRELPSGNHKRVSSNGYGLAYDANDSKILLLQDKRIQAYGLDGAKIGTPIDLPFKASHAVVSPDQQRLLLAYEQGVIEEMNLSDFRSLRKWETHKGKINSLSYAADGSKILSTSNGGEVYVRNLRNDRLTKFVEGKGDILDAIFFDKDQYVASTSGDNKIRIWHAHSAKKILVLSGHTKQVYALAAANDGQRLLSIAEDGSLRKWELNNRHRELWIQEGEEIKGIAFSGKGREMLVANQEGQLKSWGGNQSRSSQLQNFASGIEGIHLSPDRKLMALIPKSGYPGIYSLASQAGNSIQELKDQRLISAKDVDVSQRWLAAVDKRKAYLWTRKGSFTGEFPKNGRIFGSKIAISPKENMLLCVGENDDEKELAFLWSIQAGREQQISIDEVEGNVSEVFFDPSGDKFYLASTSFGAPSYLYAYSTKGNFLNRFFEHNSPITALAISPDKKLLLTGCGDGSMSLWDWASKEEQALLSLMAHEGEVITDVGFSPDGKYVATATEGGVVRLWLIAPREMLAN